MSPTYADVDKRPGESAPVPNLPFFDTFSGDRVRLHDVAQEGRF